MLDVITLDQTRSDYINRVLTITDEIYYYLLNGTLNCAQVKTPSVVMRSFFPKWKYRLEQYFSSTFNRMPDNSG